MRIERSANVKKLQPELLGVDINDPQQQDFLRFLDVPSLSNKDILLRNELSYCMQTFRDSTRDMEN